MMAGRLEGHDDFIRMSDNNMTGEKKAMRHQDDKKKIEDELAGENSNLALKSSKDNHLIAAVFYSEKIKDGFRKVYRLGVVPDKRESRWSEMYLEFIDVKAMRRKLFRRDRIIKVKLTEKKFEGGQQAIGFK